MKKVVFFLSLIAHLVACPLVSPLTAALLAPPTFVEGPEEHPFEMGWEREEVRFGFQADGDTITLALELPFSYWEELPSKDKDLFRITSNGKYLFGYTTGVEDGWEIALGILERRDSAKFDYPLIGDGSLPTLIDDHEVREWITGKKVVFYTGAGLSIASGIPDMRKLEEKLGFLTGLSEAILRWTFTPDLISEGVASFRNACLKSDPSRGHHALSHLSIMTNQQILTENLDWMHERGGTRPLRVSKTAISETECLEEIDAVICIGLSNDDKGFLRWMKEHHPEVKLIAVNLSCPHYLASDDFWCPGDAHEVLENLVLETRSNKLAFIALNR